MKFNCEDSESRYFAASPYCGEIIKKLIINTSIDFQKEQLEIQIGTPLYNSVYEGVKKNLERTVEWETIDLNSRKEHLNNLVSPYKFEDNISTKLIEYANKFHARR